MFLLTFTLVNQFIKAIYFFKNSMLEKNSWIFSHTTTAKALVWSLSETK